jgi:hypothetical protein
MVLATDYLEAVGLAVDRRRDSPTEPGAKTSSGALPRSLILEQIVR